MKAEFEEVFKALTLEAWPREACAVCTEDKVFSIENISLEEDSFELCPVDLAKVWQELGGSFELTYIWHSHCSTKQKTLLDLRTPSEEDLELHEKTKIPLLISAYNGQTYFPSVEFPKRLDDKAPLLGRPYVCGISDCGTLITDLYARELGISLTYKFKPAYLHLSNWPKAVAEFLELNGFKQVETWPQPYDLLVIPFLNRAEAHGVMVSSDGENCFDQKEVSGLFPIENYINLPHKVYRRKL
jgi:proteasome lid subunit RPN8/RPN11